MHENSPHWLFDPNSPGWLKRRLANNEYVSGEDVARIVEANPECASDPVIFEHMVRCLRDEVKKPKGRPKETMGRRARIMVAGMLAREQAALWKQGIGDDIPPQGRGEKNFSEVAWEKFALPLNLTGPALANAVSSLKDNPLFGE